MSFRSSSAGKILLVLVSLALMLVAVPMPAQAAASSLGASKTYTVRTTVTLNGSPKGDVTVTLMSSTGSVSSKTTGSDGKVAFSSVKEGSGYYFRVAGKQDYLDYDGEDKGYTFSLPGTVPNIRLSKDTDWKWDSDDSGNSGSGSSGSGGSGSSGGGFGSSSAVATASWRELTPELAGQLAAEKLALSQEGQVVQVGAKNIGKCQLAAFQKISEVCGKNRKAAFYTDQMNGNAVDVRLIIDPAKATKEITLAASAHIGEGQKTATRLSKYFSNQFIVLHMEQNGEYGTAVQAAFKLGQGMKADNLMLYRYNSEKNTYSFLAAIPAQQVDKNGFLHLSTTAGGSLIISDGPLKNK